MLGLWVFYITLAFFGIIAFSNIPKVRSVYDFFHDPSANKTIISLVVSNVTLGTGMIYLIQGSQFNGILYLAVPVFVWFGYWLLNRFISILPEEMVTNRNLFLSLNEQISDSKRTRWNLKNLLSWSLIAIYGLLIAFEIFASSTLLSHLIYKDASTTHQVIISLVIFCVALLYTTVAGYKGVLRSDFWQLFLIIGALASSYYLVLVGLDSPAEVLKSKLIFTNPKVWITALTGIIAAVSTQFYSLLNYGGITHISRKEQGRSMKRAGLYSGILLLFIGGLGLLLHPDQSIFSLLTTNVGPVLTVLLIAGFLAIILSTIDTIMLTITMFYYENIMNRSSFDRNADKSSLRGVRLRVALFFLLSLLGLSFFNFTQPDVFYLLLAIAGGISVFAPMIVCLALLAKKGQLAKLTTRRTYTYFLLFLAANVTAAYATATQNVSIAPYIGTVSCLLSIAYSAVLYRSVMAQSTS